MTTAHDGKNGVGLLERRRPLFPDVERYFDRFWRGLAPRGTRPFGRMVTEAWLPEVDLFEREGKLVLRADVPGMKAEDIDVTVAGDMLTVSGKREEEKEVKEENYYCSERSSGEFSRTIRLPEGTTAEAIEATYKDGVLEVTVPKPAHLETKPAKIPVK
jgi:HSP20 family protein